MFIFPVHIFNPSSCKLRLVARTIDGGEAINGEQDVIATDGGGRWIVEYSGFQLIRPETLRAWEAWEAYLDGGAVDVLCPILSLSRANRPFLQRGPAKPSGLTWDDWCFPESLEYSGDYIVASSNAASLRATELTINVQKGAPLAGGETFGVGERVHRVSRVKSRPSTQSAVVNIRPPLRAALSAGSLNFNLPKLKCRLAPGQDISLDIFSNRQASPSIVFVENTI